MPYHRPLQMPSVELLATKFETAIKSLVKRFRNHPYAFYTESDMHCYLYHRLYSGGLANGLCHTADGFDTILLHKEYPTDSRFKRQDDGKLEISNEGRRRGAYDIVIWDPRGFADRDLRKQKVLCAAELALNECGPNNQHTFNDAMKLSSLSVPYGYLLYFVRDNKACQRNLKEIRDNLDDASNRVRVMFIQIEGDLKPKAEFLGAWGVIKEAYPTNG